MKNVTLSDNEISKIILCCIHYREYLGKMILSMPEDIRHITTEEYGEVQGIIRKMLALEDQD
jgi:hypothetical protein